MSRANCLHYSSYKSKRVVRSLLAGELYVVVDAYDYANLLRYDLAHVLSTWFPLVKLTEYMSLFDLLIHTNTISTEKWLVIDINTFRKANERRDITDVGWLRSGQNISNAFTKPGPCHSLSTSLTTRILQLHMAEWMVRYKQPVTTNNNRQKISARLATNTNKSGARKALSFHEVSQPPLSSSSPDTRIYHPPHEAARSVQGTMRPVCVSLPHHRGDRDNGASYLAPTEGPACRWAISAYLMASSSQYSSSCPPS